VLALRAAGVAPSGTTLAWLRRQQDRDGGFNFGTAGGTSDVDDTGAVLEALGSNPRAVAFIERRQNRDGGFPSDPGAESNAQSTAWAVQGLLAAGGGAGGVDRGVGYLSSLIAPDGHVRYSRSSDQTPVWVTGEAMMALARKPLPLAAATRPGSNVTARHASSHHRRARHVTRGRHAHHAAVVSRAPASPATLRLASDAGVVAALALAPVGLG
jgi:prenyltransferase beta subunit